MVDRLTLPAIEAQIHSPADLLDIGADRHQGTAGVPRILARLCDVEFSDDPTLAEFDALADAVGEANIGFSGKGKRSPTGAVIPHETAISLIQDSGVYEPFYGSLTRGDGTWEQYDAAVILGGRPEDVDRQVDTLLDFDGSYQEPNLNPTKVHRVLLAGSRRPIQDPRQIEGGFEGMKEIDYLRDSAEVRLIERGSFSYPLFGAGADFSGVAIDTVEAPDAGDDNVARMAAEHVANWFKDSDMSRFLVVAPPGRAPEHGERFRTQARRIEHSFDDHGDDVHVLSRPMPLLRLELATMPSKEKDQVLHTGLEVITGALQAYRRLMDQVPVRQAV